ncbi:hypothetical protein LTR37_007225 [Vermiconidia calcicola]|uniref:Uncharacterized protein n=1 Tax=Vermiconidia calcicola TaxID=1690605 RepID=A0ACC3NE90_9PEZI|nr:hypothetical protein LTR37_007225 [Vermiconidia calcicola]
MVWDPQARQSPSDSPGPRHDDDLPPFAVLTTDDDRERKAETRRPGTFGVVVTPESFSELPEYAGTSSSPDSRRMSVQSQTSSFSNNNSSLGRSLSRGRTDPNVVVLDRFEDVSSTSAGPFRIPSPARRPSLPDGLQYLTISTSSLPTFSPSSSSPSATPSLTPGLRPDNHFISHFRHYVLPLLVQPQIGASTNDVLTDSTRDMFEVEALRFPPLHHAICAVSALHLSYNGRATMELALQHYHQALSSQTSAVSPDELLSDGAFLRHFLLFIYDICVPTQHEEGSAGMWAIHLNHLQRIATGRHEMRGRERLAYLVWTICELDIHACLLGSGSCGFARHALQFNMLPPIEQQMPFCVTSPSGPYFANEIPGIADILALNQGVLIHLANIAHVAQEIRQEAADQDAVSPGVTARWQATVSRLQADLSSFWGQRCPDYLALDPIASAQNLPYRVRYVFEHAYLMYQTATIYSRTSMLKCQRRFPIANQQEVFADTERRTLSIMRLVSTYLASRHFDRRHVVFPLFMAGFATTQPDVKIQALDVIKAFESTGIGQNTYVTRRLLTAVCEEQRRFAEAGGKMEDVDWFEVARDRSLTVINCGL